MKRLKYSRSTAFDVDARGRFGERHMREAERRRIAAAVATSRASSVGIRRAREQRGEQRIFLRAREIDLVDVGCTAGSPIEIGPQTHARDAGRGLDRKHALGGNRVPVRNGRLRNTDAAREFGDAADGLDRFLKSRIAHSNRLLRKCRHYFT